MRAEPRGRAEVQMNLPRLFASSDVVPGARVHPEICFPALALNQSRGAGAQKADPAREKYGSSGGFSMAFFSPSVLKFPHIALSFLTVCCVCLQNVLNLLLEDFSLF